MKREVTFCDVKDCKNFNTQVCPLCRRDHCSLHEKQIIVELKVDQLQISPYTTVCEMCAAWLYRYIHNLNRDNREADPVYGAHFSILRKALDEILTLLSAQIAAAMIEKS